MNPAQTVSFVMIAALVCMAVAVVAVVVAFAFAVFYLGRRLGASRHAELEKHIEEWALDNGYEFLRVDNVTDRAHPFADRFGFGAGKGAGAVKMFEVRDRKGRTRRGWAFFKADKVGKHYSGFRLDSMEIEWDE